MRQMKIPRARRPCRRDAASGIYDLPRFYAAERGFDRPLPRVIAQQRPDLRAARTMSLIRRSRLSSLLSPSPHLLFPRRPAASASCPRVCTSPRTRGGWSADRRTRLLCRACEARRSALAIRGPSRCNRDALSALHRGGFRPGTRAAVSGSGAPEPTSDLPAPGHTARRAGSRTSRGAVRSAAAGRHSPLRLQDRLRRRPS